MRADRICGTSKSERETRILHRHLFLQHGIRCPLFLFPSSSGWHELAVACTRMANWWHVQRLKRRGLDWAFWRAENISVRPDLSSANLRGLYLSGADLNNADLNGARLGHAHLDDANLHDADLSRASLRGTNLRGANLRGAKMGGTVMANIDLRETKGLSEIDHRGPSHIELYSVQLPQDGSALHFLRGVGVPDEWMEFWRSAVMHPIQYHSCFISYASPDEVLAQRLYADLQASGVRCWFAPKDLKIGSKFRQRIDEAIHLQDKLLLLLSKHSVESTWVENEVEAALEKEDRQHREVLFPVRLDDAVMQPPKAWTATLRRTRHIGDFTRWTDPQAYQSAFDRLLRDLKQN